MRSILKTASAWGFVGIGIAVLFFSLLTLADHFTFFVSLRGFAQDIVLLLWPSSFWLMATEGAGRVTAFGILAMALLANFVTYFVAGTLLTAAWRWLKRFA